VHTLADNVIQFEEAQTLRREWEPRQPGAVIWRFNTWRGIDFQARGAFVRPEALLDRSGPTRPPSSGRARRRRIPTPRGMPEWELR